MAETSTPEERTEAPTDRRMGQLRREGAIHLSQDAVQVITLIAGFYALHLTWEWVLEDMKFVFIRSFQLVATPEFVSLDSFHSASIRLILLVAPPIVAIVLVVAVVATITTMLQTDWNMKERKIHFRFFQLNPIAGLKKIFSIHGVLNTLKAIVKMSLILPIGYFALKGIAPSMIMLIHLSVPDVMAFTGIQMTKLFWKIVYVLIALAIFDYFYSKFRWFRQNKMTKDEVKDERKSIEGDERTKRKIQQKGLQRIANRLKMSVRQADVVVTNPTHYSIALKYDRSTMEAPTVVAKGKGFIALRIRELAREAGVPMIQRRLLARSLYSSTEVGAQIPRPLFKAVAEVLAYVYKLRNPNRYRPEAQG